MPDAPQTPTDQLSRLEQIIHHMNFGVVVVRPTASACEFLIEDMNRGAEKIEGIHARDAAGRCMCEVFPYLKDSGLYDALRGVAMSRAPRHHQTRLYRQGLLTHCHNDYIFPLDTGELAIVYYDSTERAQTEEQLRLQGQAIEQSIDGIALADLKGHFVFVNPALARIHGYTPAELLGQHYRVLHSEAQMRSEIRPIIREVWRTGSHIGEVNRVRKDGTIFPSILSVTVFRDSGGKPRGLVAVVRDITLRKAAVDRLRILEAAVREATDGVLITDADLDEPGPLILFANQGFTQMTGYVPEEVVGRNPRILQGTKTDLHVLHDMGLHLRRGEPWTGQMVNYRKDRSEFLIELHISPVHNDAGEITHFVAIQRDVTERERAKEAQRVFEQMTTIARTAVTYNHEINNPVAALSGYAELLLRDETDPEKRESLQAILRSAGRIAEVTRKIQKLSDPAFKPYLEGGAMMLDLDEG